MPWRPRRAGWRASSAWATRRGRPRSDGRREIRSSRTRSISGGRELSPGCSTPRRSEPLAARHALVLAVEAVRRAEGHVMAAFDRDELESAFRTYWRTGAVGE